MDSRLAGQSNGAGLSIGAGAYKSARIDNRVCIGKTRTLRLRGECKLDQLFGGKGVALYLSQ